MASVHESLSSLGASRHTIQFVESAYRSGTNKVYDSRWARWIRWCESHGTDPIKPQAVELANFLASLAATEGLSSSSVKVYRSAIVTSLTQMGGRVRGLSSRPSLLRDLVRGIDASSATAPRRVPLWDLFLVLGFLRSSPFEPLSSLDRKFLTLKAVFLVALASGRRASEVNALSGSPQDISRERDGSFVLSFLPEFRAKNQGALERSPKIRIPPLSSILAPDDEDRFLCPVRALARYLKVVSSTRHPSCRKLFVSLNPEYNKDISVSTIARWIMETVRLAYNSVGSSLPPSRAHELRAWSASVALHQSVPLRDILEAAFWKSESTFSNFYLRDASAAHQDGSHSISSVVVAQRALTRLQ